MQFSTEEITGAENFTFARKFSDKWVILNPHLTLVNF